MSKLFAIAFLVGVATAFPVGPIGAPCFANESASELFTEISLAGKVAVVTGSDTGIGLEVARALAASNATVVLAGRNFSKMQCAAADIKTTVPGADLIVPQQALDLASFATVRLFAKALQHFSAIHILVNNAGVASTSHPVLTKDHMDLVFEVDYASTWLLTHLLLPQLRAGKGRIVNVASKAASFACEMNERWDCTKPDRLPPPPTSGSVPLAGLPRSNYGLAKLLMIIWTEDLAKREAAVGGGVTAFSLHPGFVNTTVADQFSKVFSRFACMSDGRQGAPCPTTTPIGALTPTFLAIAPGVEKHSGSYYEWCAVAKLPAPYDNSQSYKDELWKLTETWVANFSEPVSFSGAAKVVV